MNKAAAAAAAAAAALGLWSVLDDLGVPAALKLLAASSPSKVISNMRGLGEDTACAYAWIAATAASTRPRDRDYPNQDGLHPPRNSAPNRWMPRRLLMTCSSSITFTKMAAVLCPPAWISSAALTVQRLSLQMLCICCHNVWRHIRRTIQTRRLRCRRRANVHCTSVSTKKEAPTQRPTADDSHMCIAAHCPLCITLCVCMYHRH